MFELLATLLNPHAKYRIQAIEFRILGSLIAVDLVLTDGEDTVYHPINIDHDEFRVWLDANLIFEREDVFNSSNTVTGEHDQRVSRRVISYQTYLDHYLCQQDIYDYLKANNLTKYEADKL